MMISSSHMALTTHFKLKVSKSYQTNDHNVCDSPEPYTRLIADLVRSKEEYSCHVEQFSSEYTVKKTIKILKF